MKNIQSTESASCNNDCIAKASAAGLVSEINSIKNIKESLECKSVDSKYILILKKLKFQFEMQKDIFTPPCPDELDFLKQRLQFPALDIDRINPVLFVSAYNMHMHICEADSGNKCWRDRKARLEMIDWKTLMEVTCYPNKEYSEIKSILGHFSQAIAHQVFFDSLTNAIRSNKSVPENFSEWLPIISLGAHQLYYFFRTKEPSIEWITKHLRGLISLGILSSLSKMESVQAAVSGVLSEFPNELSEIISIVNSYAKEANPFLVLICSALFIPVFHSQKIPLPTTTVGGGIIKSLPYIRILNQLCSGLYLKKSSYYTTGWLDKVGDNSTGGECWHINSKETTLCKNFYTNNKIQRFYSVLGSESQKQVLSRERLIKYFQGSLRPANPAGSVNYITSHSLNDVNFYESTFYDGNAGDGTYAEFLANSRVRIYQWNSAGLMSISDYEANESQRKQLKILLGGWRGGRLSTANEKSINLPSVEEGNTDEPTPFTSYSENRHPEARLAIGAACALALAGAGGSALIMLGAYGVMLYFRKEDICIPLAACSKKNTHSVGSPNFPFASLWPSIGRENSVTDVKSIADIKINHLSQLENINNSKENLRTNPNVSAETTMDHTEKAESGKNTLNASLGLKKKEPVTAHSRKNSYIKKQRDNFNVLDYKSIYLPSDSDSKVKANIDDNRYKNKGGTLRKKKEHDEIKGFFNVSQVIAGDEEQMLGDDPNRSSNNILTEIDRKFQQLLMSHLAVKLSEIKDMISASAFSHQDVSESKESFSSLDDQSSKSSSIQPSVSNEGKKELDLGSFFNNNYPLPVGSTYTLVVEVNALTYLMSVAIPTGQTQAHKWQSYVLHKLSEMSMKIDEEIQGGGTLIFTHAIQDSEGPESESNTYRLYVSENSSAKSVNKYIRISPPLPAAASSGARHFTVGDNILTPDCSGVIGYLNKLIQNKGGGGIQTEVYCDVSGQFYTQWGPLSLNNDRSPFITDWSKTASLNELTSLKEFWEKFCEKVLITQSTQKTTDSASAFLHVLKDYADDLRQDVISNPKKFLNKYFRNMGAAQDIMDLKVTVNILRSYDLPVQNNIPNIHIYNLAGIKVRTHNITEKVKLSVFELITRPEVVESFKKPSQIIVTDSATNRTQVVDAENSVNSIEFPDEIPEEIIKNIQDVWQQPVYREKALEILDVSSKDIKFKTGVIQELNRSLLRTLQGVAQGNFTVNNPPHMKTPNMCPPSIPSSSDDSNRINDLMGKAGRALIDGKGLYLLKQDDAFMSRSFLIPDVEPNKYALIRLDSSVVTIIHIDPDDEGLNDAVISDIQSGFPPESISKGKCVPSVTSMVSLIALVKLERHKFSAVSADGIILEAMWDNFIKMSEKLIEYTFHDKKELNAEMLAQDFRDYVVPVLTGLTVILPFGQVALFPELMALEGAAGILFRLAEEGLQITIDTANYGLIAGLTGELLLESLADADRPLLAARDHQALLNSLVVDFILMSPAFMPKSSADERISAAFSEAERLGVAARSGSEVSLSSGLNKFLTAIGKQVQIPGEKLIRINIVDAIQYLPKGTPILMSGVNEAIITDSMIIDSDAQLWRLIKPSEDMSKVKIEKITMGNNGRLCNTVLCPTLDDTKVSVFVTDNEKNRAALAESDYFSILPERDGISNLVELVNEGEHCVLANPTLTREKRVPLHCNAGKKISAEDLFSIMLKLDISLGISSGGVSVNSWRQVAGLTRDVGFMSQEELIGQMIALYINQKMQIKAHFTQILKEIKRNTPEGLTFLMSTLAGNRIALNRLIKKGTFEDLAASDIFGKEFTEITDVSNLYDIPEGAISVIFKDGKCYFLVSKGRNVFYGINAGKELPERITGLGKIDDDTISWTAVSNDKSGAQIWVHSKFGDFYSRRISGMKLTPEETLQILSKPETEHSGLSAAQTTLYNERINSYVGPVFAEIIRTERGALNELNEQLNFYAGKNIPEELKMRSSNFESALNALPHYRDGICYSIPSFAEAGSLKKGDVLMTHSFNEYVSELSTLQTTSLPPEDDIVLYHISTTSGIIFPDNPGDGKYSKGTVIIPPGNCFEVIDVLSSSQATDSVVESRNFKIIVLKPSLNSDAVNRRNIATGKFDDEHFSSAPTLFKENDIPVLDGKELSKYLDALAFGQYHAAAMGEYHVKGTSIFKSEFPGYANDIKKEIAAVQQLPSYIPEDLRITNLYRGNDMAKDTLGKIIKGDIGYIQNHRILFTSTSEEVARRFIIAPKIDGKVPVLFKMQYNPNNINEVKFAKLGRKNPGAYARLIKDSQYELSNEDIEEIKNSKEVLFGRGVFFKIKGYKSINSQPLFGDVADENQPGVMVTLEIMGSYDDVYDVTFNGQLPSTSMDQKVDNT